MEAALVLVNHNLFDSTGYRALSDKYYIWLMWGGGPYWVPIAENKCFLHTSVSLAKLNRHMTLRMHLILDYEAIGVMGRSMFKWKFDD